MKTFCQINLIIALCLVSPSCNTVKSNAEKAKNTSNELFLFQSGEEKKINNENQTIEIGQQAFSLRFYNRRYNADTKEFYSAQIAAFLNKSELDKIKVGMQKSDIPCFAPGTGIAANKSGKYESLVFNNRGHHYTTYENSESKRLNMLSEADDLLKLEFEINHLNYNGEKVKMNETDLKEFYIAFLIDHNLNGKIDQGELNKLTIKIK